MGNGFLSTLIIYDEEADVSRKYGKIRKIIPYAGKISSGPVAGRRVFGLSISQICFYRKRSGFSSPNPEMDLKRRKAMTLMWTGRD